MLWMLADTASSYTYVWKDRAADESLGKTYSTSETEDENLSIDVLVADFAAVIQSVFPDPSAAPTLLVTRS